MNKISDHIGKTDIIITMVYPNLHTAKLFYILNKFNYKYAYILFGIIPVTTYVEKTTLKDYAITIFFKPLKIIKFLMIILYKKADLIIALGTRLGFNSTFYSYKNISNPLYFKIHHCI